jgi:hypothetical protein
VFRADAHPPRAVDAELVPPPPTFADNEALTTSVERG